MTIDDDDGPDHVSTDGEEDYIPEDDLVDNDNDNDMLEDDLVAETSLLCEDENIDKMKIVMQNENMFGNEDYEKIKDPIVQKDIREMSTGMCWDNMIECRRYFKRLAIEKHFQFKQESNDVIRYRLKCKGEDWNWKANCRRVGDNDCTVVLKSFNAKHTCPSLGRGRGKKDGGDTVDGSRKAIKRRGGGVRMRGGIPWR
ncbi:hypothetical protein FRX31_014955 [Thalictrum thalictroides]|uniref:Transposase MuDR plant domain-containing protein n=1 Tax=Thalictrum thalictroides TaxID=46969 RepID=A0A7J6WF42_THATH|nr:hypothetical protein FRX31_014955 [Thalictrum thalictroides]